MILQRNCVPLLLLQTVLYNGNSVIGGNVHINRNIYEQSHGNGYRQVHRLPYDTKNTELTPQTSRHNAQHISQLQPKEGWRASLFENSPARNIPVMTGYSPSLGLQHALERNIGLGIKHKNVKVPGGTLRQTGLFGDITDARRDKIGNNDMNGFQRAVSGGAKQRVPRFRYGSLKSGSMVPNVTQRIGGRLNNLAGRQYRTDNSRAVMSNIPVVVTVTPLSRDSGLFDGSAVTSLKNNMEFNGKDHQGNKDKMYDIVETVDDLAQDKRADKPDCEKDNTRSKRMVAGLVRCNQERVRIQVEFREDMDSDAGPVSLICRGMEMITRCEGACESSAKPSAFYGIQMECSCCKDTSTAMREITLHTCFINGEPVNGYSLTRAILEPTSCACQQCRR